MKYSLVLLALLSFAAQADWEARQGENWVRLTQKPCTNETIKSMLGERADKYREAVAFLGGNLFNACWTPMGDVAHLQYDDGDQGLVPKDDLKPVQVL